MLSKQTAPSTNTIPNQPETFGNSLNRINPHSVLNTASIEERMEALEDSIRVSPVEYSKYGKKPVNNPNPRYRNHAVSVCIKESKIDPQSDRKLQPTVLNRKV